MTEQPSEALNINAVEITQIHFYPRIFGMTRNDLSSYTAPGVRQNNILGVYVEGNLSVKQIIRIISMSHNILFNPPQNLVRSWRTDIN